MTLDPISGGGTAERTLQISRTFIKLGHQCTVLTTNIGLSANYLASQEKDGLTIIALPSFWDRFYVTTPALSLIKKLVLESDIVHLMSHWTWINVLVYRAARMYRKPYTFCPAGALPIFGRSRFLKEIYHRVIGRSVIKHASALIAISSKEIQQFKEYGVSAERVMQIPNGVDLNDYQAADNTYFRRKFGLGDHPFVLFMGRLNPIKGPDLLLEAFSGMDSRLDHYHLVFAGPDGGMQAELTKMADSFGIQNRVHFIGYIGGVEKSQAYHATEMLIIPSRKEAMSIVALEAGISETPVLLTDQCGFDEIEGAGGGIVVPASVDGIKKGLMKMLEQPDELRLMGANMKRLVSDHYSWEKIAALHLDLYEKILNKYEPLINRLDNIRG
jgi:glycosyltransferase involved in cell wall biosynthesis